MTVDQTMKKGRPLKADAGDSMNRTVQNVNDSKLLAKRARGRDAQRRYRDRKEEQIRQLQQQNDELEELVGNITSAIVSLGQEIGSEGFSQSMTFATSYNRVIKYIHGVLTTRNHQQIIDGLVPVPQENSSDFENVLDFYEASDIVPERVSGRPPAAYHMSQGIPRSIVQMPTFNPTMATDMLAPGNQTFAFILMQNSLLKVHEALNAGLEGKYRNWLHRTHSVSLKYASVKMQLFLTSIFLAKMTQVAASYDNLQSIFEDDGDIGYKMKILSLAVKKDLGNQGSELLSAMDVESYLQERGLSLNTDSLTLRIDQQVSILEVTLDLEKLCHSLIDSAVCLGNGIGYRRNMLNHAIIASTKTVKQVS